MRNRIKLWLIKFKENPIEKILLVLLLPGLGLHKIFKPGNLPVIYQGWV